VWIRRSVQSVLLVGGLKRMVLKYVAHVRMLETCPSSWFQ
jgi:hypothetical protein